LKPTFRHSLFSTGCSSSNLGGTAEADPAAEAGPIKIGAVHRRLQSELVWLVAELAVSPFVYALQQMLLATPNPTLTAALDRWTQGYCPVCGSWPALIESLASKNIVRCSLCALAWTLDEPGCVYCGDIGPTFVTAAPDPARPDRRLETCGKCRSYVKAVDVHELSPFPLIAISDLETLDLDVLTMKQGFQRPAMKVFAASKPV